MNNNPFVKPIAILAGIVVAMYIVGKFFAPKDPPPVPEPTPPAMGVPPTAPLGNGKPSLPNGPAAKLGPKAVKLPSGLQYEDLVVGTGAEAKNGKEIEVDYTGTLTDGTKFDSSKDRNQPYALSLPGQVIAGWNEGIPGMKVGGKRKLVIPPALAYGDQGQGSIPPKSTLVFEIDLLKVK